MKRKIFGTLLYAVLLSACTSLSPKSQLLYGLSDDELNLLGQRLGYRVEALGMSAYSFTRGRHSFHVWAHRDITARRTQADHPVVITYEPSGRRRPVESRLSVERGVTFATVEEHFRRFLDEVHLPVTSPERLGERRRTMRCERLRASRWLLLAIPPPAPILPPTAFARSQRAALRSRLGSFGAVRVTMNPDL